jgi:hypothetical protein
VSSLAENPRPRRQALLLIFQAFRQWRVGDLKLRFLGRALHGESHQEMSERKLCRPDGGRWNASGGQEEGDREKA